jgi:signal transduction histidine kinase
MYGATLLVMLLASAAILRQTMREALHREFEASMRASAALVSQFFRVEVAEYEQIDATLIHIAGELVFEDRAIHVFRPDGREFTVVGATPRATGRGARASIRQHVIAPPVRRLSVPLEPALAPRWTIVVEASGAGVAAVEARIDRGIALGIPAFVVLAAVTGWWLTGRTLRPVGQMADAATNIVPGTSGRIPVADVTDELGRLGSRFNALLDRVDVALEQQRHFLADAAHELRTPLARMRSRVEVALLPPGPAAGASLVESAASVLPPVHDELIRMSNLVDELLQLARADAGRDAAMGPPQRVYLDDLVTDELHRWHVDAERAHVTLTCSALHEAPAMGDPELLRRLIGVLLENALRYTRPGGRVDVRVDTDGPHSVLVVEDDGIGIVPEERARLFERFYRGSRARQHRPDGSGLGLAIARWIVERHHGSINIESGGNGLGTRVQVVLPVG